MIFGCCIKKAEDVVRVREAGYDYFEFSAAALAQMSQEEFQALGQAMIAAQLPCFGFNSYSSGNPAIVGEDFSPYAAQEYAERICEGAYMLGAQTIGIGSPKARRLPEGYPRPRADAQLREFLGITVNVAKEYGLWLMLEPLHDKCCNYVNTVSEALELLRAMEIKGVGLVLDFYHMQVMGEGLDMIAKAAPYLLHTHISSCGPNLERGFPGMEDLQHYREIISALRAVGYDASLSVEPDAFDAEKAAECLRMLREAAGE